MAVHFHLLKIKEVSKETADAVSITFDIPPELKEIFLFEHGQNITLKATINNEELRRSYSICTAPFENELRIGIKKAYAGKFSTYANEQLKPGDKLEVLPPTGKFNTVLHPGNKKHYLALAAGSGITPILSIIKATLFTEPLSSFTLIFGNRSRSVILFFEELEALKNKYINRFHLIHILSGEQTDTPINSGRIDLQKLDELKKIIDYKNFDDFFICGPEEMIFGTKEFLEQQGIEKKKIHFELFTTPESKRLAAQPVKEINDTESKSRVTIKLDGRSIDLELGFSGNSILDAALQKGADLPFACKGGVCCSCKAKLREGKVTMDVNYGLEEEEIEQGYILTCQSHPVTEKVVVDFDVR